MWEVWKHWFEVRHSIQIEVANVKTLIWAETPGPNLDPRCANMDLGWDIRFPSVQTLVLVEAPKSRSKVWKHWFDVVIRSKARSQGWKLWFGHSIQIDDVEVTGAKTLISAETSKPSQDSKCENIDSSQDIRTKSSLQVWKHWVGLRHAIQIEVTSVKNIDLDHTLGNYETTDTHLHTYTDTQTHTHTHTHTHKHLKE